MADMSRRVVLAHCAQAVLALGLGCAGRERLVRGDGWGPDRPTTLLIIDDRHNQRALGWTGEREVLPPHGVLRNDQPMRLLFDEWLQEGAEWRWEPWGC